MCLFGNRRQEKGGFSEGSCNSGIRRQTRTCLEPHSCGAEPVRPSKPGREGDILPGERGLDNLSKEITPAIRQESSPKLLNCVDPEGCSLSPVASLLPLFNGSGRHSQPCATTLSNKGIYPKPLNYVRQEECHPPFRVPFLSTIPFRSSLSVRKSIVVPVRGKSGIVTI